MLQLRDNGLFACIFFPLLLLFHEEAQLERAARFNVFLFKQREKA